VTRKIAYAVAWAKAHPERRREIGRVAGRRYYAKNAPAIRAKARAQYDRQADSLKQRRQKYGMSAERITRMFEEQQGRCYMCDEPLDLAAKKGYTIDHDHGCCRGNKSCGECVLGLACDSCNRGAGAFGDSEDRMELAASRRRTARANMLAAKIAQTELPINLTHKEESA
jgi:hypothetical protein